MTAGHSYQKQVAKYIAEDSKALKVFTLDGSNDQKLTSLKIGFMPDSLCTGTILEVATGNIGFAYSSDRLI